jgi:transcriptional regulator with XRE-family HTH domain
MTHAELIRRKVRAELAFQEISGRQLCQRIGMSQSAFAARLTGQVELKISELQVIADALGVPLAKFLPEPEPATSSPATAGAGGRGTGALVPVGDGQRGTRLPSTRPHPDQSAVVS